MRKVLLIKALLTSNIYLPCFFILLKSHGLSSFGIMSALSIGTLVMIIGDFMTSYLVDRYGPKRPIIFAAGIQAAAVVLLTVCSSTSSLYVIEVLIGLSFPAILGADSKWLRTICSGDVKYERYNQMAFWITQILSAGIGSLLIKHGEIACYLSAGLYLSGALVACTIKDGHVDMSNYSLKKLLWDTKSVLLEKYRTLIPQAFIMGTLGTSSWLFQAKVATAASIDSEEYLFLQLLLPSSALLSTFFSTHKQQLLYLISIFAVLGIYFMPRLSSWYLILFVLVVASAVRGMMSIVAREEMVTGMNNQAPIATLIFIISSSSKLIQSLTMMILT